MLLQHIAGFFIRPSFEWQSVRQENISIGRAILHVLVLGAIPVLSGYIGTTRFGWQKRVVPM